MISGHPQQQHTNPNPDWRFTTNGPNPPPGPGRSPKLWLGGALAGLVFAGLMIGGGYWYGKGRLDTPSPADDASEERAPEERAPEERAPEERAPEELEVEDGPLEEDLAADDLSASVPILTEIFAITYSVLAPVGWDSSLDTDRLDIAPDLDAFLVGSGAGIAIDRVRADDPVALLERVVSAGPSCETGRIVRYSPADTGITGLWGADLVGCGDGSLSVEVYVRQASDGRTNDVSLLVYRSREERALVGMIDSSFEL